MDICKAPLCGREGKYRGLCATHRGRFNRHGRYETVCIREGCENPPRPGKYKCEEHAKERPYQMSAENKVAWARAILAEYGEDPKEELTVAGGFR